MLIKEKIYELLKKNDRLYVIARCIRGLNNPDYFKLVKGYYESTYKYTSVLAKHNGMKFPDKVIYSIKYFVPKNNTDIAKGSGGFCATFRLILGQLLFSDMFDMIPVVEWGSNSIYYDSSMDHVTKNVFEYYFEPVSNVDYREVNECKNVIEAHYSQAHYFIGSVLNSTIVKQDEIEQLGNIFKKYIRFNKTTKEYIDENLNSILNKKEKILAVHVRGTDYNIGLKNHPKIITPQEYLSVAKDIYSKGLYDKVFLATDDKNVLELFEREFKDNLLYYTDVFRTENHYGPHSTYSTRPMHYYKLGLEVLRDIYTLANCDSFVCCLSGVATTARYVKVALNQKFEEIIVLDHGINDKDSSEAKMRMSEWQRMNKKHKS